MPTDIPQETAQITNAFDITPSDAAEVAKTGCTIFVGGGGDLKVDLVGSGTVTYKNIADGTFLPIKVKKVYATGTTATSILGNY